MEFAEGRVDRPGMDLREGLHESEQGRGARPRHQEDELATIRKLILWALQKSEQDGARLPNLRVFRKMLLGPSEPLRRFVQLCFGNTDAPESHQRSRNSSRFGMRHKQPPSILYTSLIELNPGGGRSLELLGAGLHQTGCLLPARRRIGRD
ncbi:hypothetical protein ASC67_08730 [Methylibium sp. Root1272]|nr:hypothetical protein ASC67_08730 [Methylibium sp. Root1272]